MNKRRNRRLRGRAAEEAIRQLQSSALTNQRLRHEAERRATKAEAYSRYAGEAAVSDFIMHVCNPGDSGKEFFRAVSNELMQEAGSAFGKELRAQMDSYRPLLQTEKRIMDAVLHMAMTSVKIDATKNLMSKSYDIRINIPPINYNYRLNIPI